MRIEVDTATGKRLKALRTTHPEIGGRGQAEVVRWLISYVDAREAIARVEQNVRDLTSALPDLIRAQIANSLEDAHARTLATAIANILTGDGHQPQTPSSIRDVPRDRVHPSTGSSPAAPEIAGGRQPLTVRRT